MDLSLRSASAGQSVQPVGSSGHEHVVKFYETDQFLVDTVCAFIGPALLDGDAAVVVATATHRSAFEAALRASGVDMDAAVAGNHYLAFDAGGLLETFMVDGAPDARLFAEQIGGVIDNAGTDGRRVQIYGEMVAVLWDAGDVVSAIALEDLWNDLAGTREFSLLCAYPLRTFEDDGSAAAFERVCNQHTTVIPGDDYSLSAGTDEQQRAVAALQQEVTALRANVERLRRARQDESAHGAEPRERRVDPDSSVPHPKASEAVGAGSVDDGGRHEDDGRHVGVNADRAATALARQQAALDRSHPAEDPSQA